jgi:hypothetical protein
MASLNPMNYYSNPSSSSLSSSSSSFQPQFDNNNNSNNYHQQQQESFPSMPAPIDSYNDNNSNTAVDAVVNACSKLSEAQALMMQSMNQIVTQSKPQPQQQQQQQPQIDYSDRFTNAENAANSNVAKMCGHMDQNTTTLCQQLAQVQQELAEIKARPVAVAPPPVAVGVTREELHSFIAPLHNMMVVFGGAIDQLAALVKQKQQEPDMIDLFTHTFAHVSQTRKYNREQESSVTEESSNKRARTTEQPTPLALPPPVVVVAAPTTTTTSITQQSPQKSRSSSSSSSSSSSNPRVNYLQTSSSSKKQ